jgi:DNA-binding NtrC family response regulator
VSHYTDAMHAAGRAYWQCLLEKHGNNKSAAAREAGVHRQDVYKYIKRYGLAYQPHKGAWERGPVISEIGGREMRV